MKNRLFTLILFTFSLLLFGQKKDVKIVDDGITIQIIYEDKNAQDLKSGDSIVITDFSYLKLNNKEINNSDPKKEKTNFSQGIINSASSLIKPEEIYTFKQNSKYKIYQPNFLDDELVVNVLLSEKTNEKQLADLNKSMKFLNFVNATEYMNPRESNKRKFDYQFGKGKYSYSMILHSVQRGTLLLYMNPHQITKKNLNKLEKALAEFKFIKDIYGLDQLRKGIKGRFIIIET